MFTFSTSPRIPLVSVGGATQMAGMIRGPPEGSLGGPCSRSITSRGKGDIGSKDDSWHATWFAEFYTDELRPFAHCFQPTMKLAGKEAAYGRTRRLHGNHQFS